MALKVELKPNERIIIGSVVIRNDEQRTRFFIEGEAPILREKDILTAASADTPEEHLQKEQQRKKALLNQSIAANSTGSSVKPTYGADSAATAKPSNGTGSAAKKKSSKKKTTTYDVDPYDAGYEDVYLDYDYDEDRYRWDDDYMRGVDDAMDDLDEDW